METSPTIAVITEWLRERQTLGIGEPISVTDIDPKPWSGHFNYLVATPEKKFVLRFKGPEWGEPATGTVNEYENLKLLEPYAVGPRVFGLERDFFGEPAIFMEYLEGQPLTALAEDEKRRRFPEVVSLIAKINQIPYYNLGLRPVVERSALTTGLRLAEPYVSYERSKRAWRSRLEVIERVRELAVWVERLREILPRAEAMLDRFELRLGCVLNTPGPVFLFMSSHIGHCFVTPAGLRFINWEETTYGDPSFTLAVFLASIITRPDFQNVKAAMIQSYREILPVPEFSELVEQRLAEREVSNLSWVLWAYANRGDTVPPDEATGAPARYQRVRAILDNFGV